MLKTNYHTHCYLCGHAEGLPSDYIKKAIELGFSEIGISDHGPLLPSWTIRMNKEKMENELEKLCSSIDGVGKCSVTISFSKGAESTYKSGKLTETKPPRILGVAVACKGADSPRVRQALSELFTSLFDIPSNRVAILKLN